MKLKRYILIIAALLGAISILLGAFGAHGLKEKLSASAMDNYETAVRYMIYHVLAILMLQNIIGINDRLKNLSATLFLSGILLFSGSIFLIALGWADARSIWFVTPLGGLCFVSGWLAMAYGFIRND